MSSIPNRINNINQPNNSQPNNSQPNNSQPNNSQPNVLFYSLKCKTCNAFMTISQNNGVLKHFKLLCVDGNEKAYCEKGLKVLPTIIVKNITKPIEGKDCLKWLESILTMKSNKSFDKHNDQYLPEVGIGQSNQTHTSNQTHPSNIHNIPQNGSGPKNVFNINQPPQLGKISNPAISSTQPTDNQFAVPNTNVLKRTGVATPPPSIGSMGQMGQLKQMQNMDPNQMLNQLTSQINQLSAQLAGGQTGQTGQSAQSGQTNKPNSKTSPSVKPTSQLFGFLDNEMSGFSDNYAYLLVDNPLPKSFLPPDKDLQIYTAPEGNKLDKKTQDIYLKHMESYRENDTNDFKKNIEKVHRELLQPK